METIKYKGFEIEIGIYSDENDNPREYCNLGNMIFFHRRYNLGDKHSMSIEELNRKVK